MGSLDKTKLLGVTAVIIVLFLIGSAAASAAVWKDAGVTVSSSFEMGITGAENYEVEKSAGGVQCSERFVLSYDATIKVTTVSKFENKGSCKTFGTYSACTVNEVNAISLPWIVTLSASTLTISSMHMRHTFKAGCTKPEINETLNVTMTPDNTGKIREFSFLGSSASYLQFGNFSVDTPTYGIA